MTLTEKDLLPGDVLLSLWSGNLSSAVALVDGGDYCHASVWTGQGLIEAAIPKVREVGFSEWAKRGPIHADVFRHRTLGAKASAVVEAARAFVGNKYSFGDLALAVLVVSTSTWLPKGPLQTYFFRAACDLNLLAKLTAERKNEPVTCTELLARAFHSAQVDIHVTPASSGHVDLEKIALGIEELARAMARRRSDIALPEVTQTEIFSAAEMLFGTRITIPTEGAMRRGGPVFIKVGPERGHVGMNLVTPRQIQTSTDFTLMGRIHPAPVS